MLHVFGRVNYFGDGLTQTPQPISRGTTIPLFTTGGSFQRPVLDAKTLLRFFPRLPGYGDAVSLHWRLHSVDITQTRVWACSSAKFTLVCPFVPGSLLPLPPIHPEMPISIDLGYVTDPWDVTSAEHQIVPDGTKAEAWRVRRRFMGYVDTFKVRASGKKIIATVSCRDKLRFLIDTRMVGMFNAYDLAVANVEELKTRQITIEGPSGRTTSEPFALKLEAQGTCPREGLVRLILEEGSNGAISKEDLSSDACEYGNIDGYNSNPVREPLQPATDANFQNKEQGDEAVNEQQRAGLAEAIANTFIIMNKAPIEPLKRLAQLEADAPKELYADHNGKVYWTRRTAQRWNDPWQYYAFAQPSGVADAEPVISLTAEFSTIGTINQIVLVNPLYGTGEASSNVLAATGILDPVKAYGFDMLPRTRFIFDETLSASTIRDNAGIEKMKPVLNAEFMIWGRDIRGAEIEIFGNPALYAGDAVRCHNLPFFCYGDADIDPKLGMTQADIDLRKTQRAEYVVDQMMGEGPRKGYRMRCLLAVPIETMEDIIRRATDDSDGVVHMRSLGALKGTSFNKSYIEAREPTEGPSADQQRVT